MQEKEERQALQQAMKPCIKLLKDLLRHPMSYPFASPVDPNNYPDYYKIITVPIDLGTIKKKLDGGDYDDPEEFAADVRQVWENAFLYNQAGTDVHSMASTLKSKFEADFAKVPSVEDAVGNYKFTQMDKKMAQMQKQNMELQQMLAETLRLQQQNSAAAMTAGAAMPAPPGRQRPSSSKKGGGSRPRSSSDAFQLVTTSQPEASAPANDTSRDMSFEEKAALSGSINKLTAQNLGKVVQIIKANMPSIGDGSDEIEVDINALDRHTLWKLRHFVEGCKAKKKPAAKKAPTPSASSRMAALEQAKAQAEQRMSEVQSGLASLAGGGGGIALLQGGGNGDDDSPSNSESDEGGGGLVPTGRGGGGNGASSAYADYQNSVAEHERHLDESARRAAEQLRAKEERARQKATQIERQRAAERARRDAEASGEVDMMSQANALNEFEGDELSFGLDEYGGGGF